MNIKSLALSLVSIALPTVASLAQFSFAWGHSLDGLSSSGDNVECTTRSKTEQAYFVLTHIGSNEAGYDILMDGEALTDAAGLPIKGYDGPKTSTFVNCLLQKFDAQTGKQIWCAYSNSCDLNGKGSLAPTSDGGVVFCFSSRRGADTDSKAFFNIIDSKGVETKLFFEGQEGERVYNSGLVKFDKDGAVVWARSIVAGVNTQEYKITVPGEFRDVVSDDNDNIYICGNICSSFKFETSDGAGKILSANCSNADWRGDPQVATGDAILVKLSPEGFYEQSFQSVGGRFFSQFYKILYSGGQLYLCGTAKSISENQISFDGQNLEISADNVLTPFLAKVSADDLSVSMLKGLPSSVNEKVNVEKVDVKIASFDMIDNCLVVCGTFRGSIGPLSTPTAGYLGYVIKCSAETGEIVAGAQEPSGLSYYSGAFQTHDGHFWVVAYASIATGVYGYVLEEFDPAFNKIGDSHILVKGGSCLSPSVVFADDDRAVISVRCGKSSSKLSSYVYDGDAFSNLAWETATFNNWGVAHIAINLPSNGELSLRREALKAPTLGVFSLDGVRRPSSGRGLFVVNGKLSYRH